MAIGESTVGLIFKLKADSNDAANEIKKLQSAGDGAFSSLTKGFGQTSGAASSLGSALPIVGTAILAVGTAAVGTGAALFRLAESASEFGSQIYDITQKTGLSAEAISSLKFAADQAGSSIEQVSGAITKFSKLIATAAEGSNQAKETLIKLGLDPKTAINDLDGSLAAVFKRIAEAENPIIATKLATDAFGKSGADIIPVIKSFDGDLKGLIAQCKKLGVAINDEAAAKADAFGDTLDTAKAQIGGVANQIAFELIPNITELAGVFSDFLTNNKSEIISWSKTAIDYISRAITNARLYIAILKDLKNGILNSGNAANYNETKNQIDQEERERKSQQDTNDVNQMLNDRRKRNQQADVNPLDTSGGGNTEAEKRRKEREEAFQKELQARQDQIQILLRQQREDFTYVQEEWEKAFESGEKSKEEYRQTSLENIAKYEQAVKNLLAQQVEADQKGKTGTELENVNLEYGNAVKALEREVAKEREDVEKNITDTQKKENEKRVADTKESLDRDLQLKEMKSKTFLARQRVLLAEGNLTEKQFAELRQKEELDLLNLKKTNLQEQLNSVKGNAEKEAEINQSLLLLDEEITQKKQENAVEIAGFNKRDIEAKRASAEEIKKLKREELEAERQLTDFRAAQTKKSLENTVENSRGKDRIKALQDLRDFEIAEENRKQKQRNDDLEAEKTAALDRIKGTADELDKKFEIDQLYKKRLEISEEEFQARLKEIRDNFATASTAGIPTSGVEQGGGAIANALGSLFGDGTEDSLKLFQPIAEGITSAFNSMAQAAGNAVAAFVKFGSAGGSFRKFAAEMIAAIAQMATVQAIWNLAEGFAKLAMAYFGHPTAGASATQHFIAAGIYGTIAGVAAIAGRAVAGNAFKQGNAANANAQSQSAQTSQNRQAQTEEALRIIAEDRANPSRNELMVKLQVESNDSHIVNVVQTNVDNNDVLRSMFVKLAEAV